MQTFGNKIVAAAEACLHTPFVHQGRVPGVGLDCAGLGIVCAKSVGLDIKDFTGYPRLPFDGMLKKMFDEQSCLLAVSRSEMAAGDVLLMRIVTEPQHVAIYCGSDIIIHAYSDVGKVVRQRLNADLRGKIVAVYRFLL